MSRFRGYVFTLNNYNDSDIQKLRQTECRYIIWGKEVGEQGTPHLQGFIRFTEKKSFNQVKAALGNNYHIERQRGSCQQAIDYCKKDGQYEEVGDPPLTQRDKGDVEKQRWKRAVECAKEGKFDEIDPDILLRNYGNIKRLCKDSMPDIPDANDVTGVWLYGEAGNGKSRYAREKYPGSYLKMCNKWWDGYKNEEHVIIDDVDTRHEVLGHHFKIWSDRYCFLAENKGGAIKIRPKTIIVTSQYQIDDIWSDEPTRAALNRRFKVYYVSREGEVIAQ
jgi:hypothetical protein